MNEDRAERLARQIRSACGSYNDDAEPVVLCVAQMRERIAELETGLAKQAASAKMGMGAAKASALAAERNAERLNSECGPEALDAERSTNEKLTKYIAELEAHQVPEGWAVRSASDGEVKGFVVGTPRTAGGLRHNTSIWSDTDDPAEQLLYALLAATPEVRE